MYSLWRKFWRQIDLKVHEVHENKKLFICNMCSKTFKESWGNKIVQNSKMKKHMLSVHEGNKAFECETCDKVICGLKLTPHFTLFDPANMIPTLGNRGLPNSAMLCCQPRATSISSGWGLGNMPSTLLRQPQSVNFAFSLVVWANMF